MSEPSARRDEVLARLALVAADASPRHLDDNDLALLQMGALSPVEARALRKHSAACEGCRQLAGDALRIQVARRPASKRSVSSK